MIDVRQTSGQKTEMGIKKLRNFVFVTAGIVAVIVLGIFIIDKQNASEKTTEVQPIRVICPEHPLHRVEARTPGNEKWSELVHIPRECAIQMLGDDTAVTIQTLPNEKQYGPGDYVSDLQNTAAVRFRTAKKDTITAIFCPYEIFKKKSNKCI